MQGYGGMSSHILAMYVVYLLRKRKLNQLMNAFMTFRTVVTQLCESLVCFSNGTKVYNVSDYIVKLSLHDCVVNLAAEISISYMKITFHCIFSAQASWSKEGISLAGAASSSDAPSIQDFHQHFPVVFVDGSGFVNLCAGMTKCTFNLVKRLLMHIVGFAFNANFRCCMCSVPE